MAMLDQVKIKIYYGLGRPAGTLGVWLCGHRHQVGGMWEEIGQLQFDFMVGAGLRPEHVLLDIACGSLRAGVHFIPYLNRGNYLGLDRERRLIELGIERELGKDVYEDKAPEFVVSSKFEFEKFTKKPNFALAQSLFTHLAAKDIIVCLTRLRKFVDPGTRFFATYFIRERSSKRQPPRRSHPHLNFFYPRRIIEEFGTNSGWRPNYIGDWNHPRGQMMVEYIAE